MGENARTITIGTLWRVMWTHRVLVAVTVLVFVAVGILIAFLITPVYRAEVLLSAVTTTAPGPLTLLPREYAELMRTAGYDSYDQERYESLAVLRSRGFTMDFIREEKLMPVLFSDQWDVGEKSWRAGAKGDTPTIWEAYEFFDTGVRGVHDDYTTGLITLSVEWTDPDVAARWANALVLRVNRHLQERAIEEAERSLEFLVDELDRTSVAEVRDAIYGLMEAQMERAMVANVREEYGFRVLDPGVPPEKHVRPNRKLIAIAFFVLGVLASVRVSFWVDARGGLRPREAEPGV